MWYTRNEVHNKLKKITNRGSNHDMLGKHSRKTNCRFQEKGMPKTTGSRAQCSTRNLNHEWIQLVTENVLYNALGGSLSGISPTRQTPPAHPDI